MDDFKLFLPLSKFDANTDLLSTLVAQETPDHSREIMDYPSAVPEFKKWSDSVKADSGGKSLGNVRVMHGSTVAGKVVALEYDDVAKSISAQIKITNLIEKAQVAEGSYTGISIGGKYLKKWKDPNDPTLMRYTPVINEISLVDRPCIPTAVFKGRDFEYVGEDGKSKMRKFKMVKEADAALKQVWQAEDGSIFDGKAEALQKNLDLAVAAVPDAVSAAMAALKKANDAATAAGVPELPVEEPVTEPVVESALGEAEPVVEGAADSAAELAVEKTEEVKVASLQAAIQKGVLAKGLSDIPLVVDVINSLNWLQEALNWDTLFSDNTVSTLPVDLKGILSSLCSFLTAMVEDATKDITEDAAKAITFDQAEALRKFTGKADLLPTITAPAAAEPVEGLEKIKTEHAAEMQKVHDDLAASTAREEALVKRQEELTKTVTDLTSGITGLTDRISKLEAQPVAAKGIKNATVITKGHEGQATGAETAPDEDLIKQFKHLPPAEARAELAKALAERSQ